ncbi:MAG: hypothetical protein K6A67_07070 [Bacteroidales bacterium]|nr:hypothetical protein [Bacteroidales bacterium]
MKKITVALILLTLGATSCNGQIPTDYCGKYKVSLDTESLLASLAEKTAEDGTLSSVTVTRTDSLPSETEFLKSSQRKAQEILDSYTSKGFKLESSKMSMQTNTYDIITIKSNSIENANPMTKKTETLYEWKDSDISHIENGYRIKASDGSTVTLERINPTTIRIPEMYLILSSITQ